MANNIPSTRSSSQSGSTVYLNDSPVDVQLSPLMTLHLPVPSTSAGTSSHSLNRQNSATSARSALIPSPRLNPTMLPPASAPPSSSSSGSGSGSKTSSLMSTPKLLSRMNSSKEKEGSSNIKRNGSLKRNDSAKGKNKEEPEALRSPMSESGSVEVIETPLLKVQNDPESGRKMINQYLVLNLIGSGAHGKVRLGRDVSGDAGEEDADVPGTGNGTGNYYAIKIVDRNPKRKRLTGFSKQKGLLGKSNKTDGGKLVNESEIRKEIAIFKKVNHPNVVRMKEIIDDPESSRIFMILEFCEGGEVVWKHDDGPALTISETRAIFRDTLLGLEYLHHQGIIHRDIKPSNLLYSNSGVVKISDFGCSHYSEALRESSAQGDDDYVDDVELAKTAGSPAFFAPEMCFSSLDNDLAPQVSRSPRSPDREIPNLTLRPPSYMDDGSETGPGEIIPLRPSMSNESALASLRSRSSAGRQRLPITNAIDVWALGVTLYCLLFGKTPFDAPNEYLLMQIIPVAEYEVPATMGRDRLPTNGSNQEANEGLDILSRLLEKSPGKRITLEQAKKHPFTLRGIPDPSTWLASTDPHAQTYVTVSNDEVAAVVQKGKFRDKIKKGIMSLGQKLQLFSATGRSRSRSIGEQDQNTPTGASASATPSAMPSQVNIQSVVSPKAKGRNALSPLPSPAPTLPRRFSLLANKSDRAPSPACVSTSDAQLSSPHLQNQMMASEVPGFHVSRPQLHLVPPQLPSMVPLVDEGEKSRSPRQVASSSSLDKYKVAAPEPVAVSPSNSLRRRQSSDIDATGRQRSTSNASSVGGFGKLVRLLSRNSSQRSSRFRKKAPSLSASSDMDEHAVVSDTTSPADAIGRISLEEGMPRKSMETFESSSYSSSNGVPSRVNSTGLHPSPDRTDRLNAWDTRHNGLRRGSGLSEHFTRALDEEEVDWDGALSDDDEYGESRPMPRSSHFLRGLDKGLGLDVDPATNGDQHAIPLVHPVATSPDLETIPDGSPNDQTLPFIKTSPTTSTHIINDFHPHPNDLHPHPYPRSPTRARGSASPYRTSSGGAPGPERARSPLGMREVDNGIPRGGGGGMAPRGSPARYISPSAARRNHAGEPLLNEGEEEEDEEEDEGLAISLNSRRGRKNSIMGKRASDDPMGPIRESGK